MMVGHILINGGWRKDRVGGRLVLGDQFERRASTNTHMGVRRDEEDFGNNENRGKIGEREEK